MVSPDLYIFKAQKDHDVIVNDNTTFSSSYIEKAKHEIGSLKSLELLPSVFVFPKNYQEDYVQASRRKDFRFSDWMIAAVTVDSNDDLISILLLCKNHIREGVVFDARISKITDLFYRGFAIQEMQDSEPVEDEIFLESLGCDSSEAEYVYYNLEDSPDFDDENVEEIQDIVVKMPEFEATQKKKIINLGNAKEVFEEEDTDVELMIEVEKPQFESFHKGRIKNLGFSGEQRKKIETSKPQPAHIDIELPVFEPTKVSRVVNLGSSSKKIKKETAKTSIQDIKTSTPSNVTFEAINKSKIINYDSVIKEESKNWKTIDLFKIKPNVFSGERAIINCKMFDKEKTIFGKAISYLSNKKSLNISNECVFVSVEKDDISQQVNSIRHFDLNNFVIVLCVVDSEDNILDVLLASTVSKLSYVVSCSDDCNITVISKSGVSLDDRALPYFTFDQLMEMVQNG